MTNLNSNQTSVTYTTPLNMYLLGKLTMYIYGAVIYQ